MQIASRQNLDAVQQSFDAAASQSLSLVHNMSRVDEQISEAFDRLKSGLANASDASAAFGDSANRAANSTAVLKSEAERLGATFGDSAEQAANSTVVLRSEAERLGGLLVPLRASAEAVAGVLNSMQEIDARIRTGRDTEQTAEAVRQIGESLKTITDEGVTATNSAVKAAESLDTLLQSIQSAEGETRRAVDALGDLASGAELLTETLRKRESPRFSFWNR